jgi:hypothetical protein
MEFREKPHTDKYVQGDYERLELCRQLYALTFVVECTCRCVVFF